MTLRQWCRANWDRLPEGDYPGRETGACEAIAQGAAVQNGVHGWNTVYNAGWEHCADIEKAYADSLPARQAQQRAAQEEAERQQSLAIANKLKQKP